MEGAAWIKREKIKNIPDKEQRKEIQKYYTQETG